MYCTRCGEELAEGAKFCSRCHRAVSWNTMAAESAPRGERPAASRQRVQALRRTGIRTQPLGMIGVVVLVLLAIALVLSRTLPRPAGGTAATPAAIAPHPEGTRTQR